MLEAVFCWADMNAHDAEEYPLADCEPFTNTQTDFRVSCAMVPYSMNADMV